MAVSDKARSLRAQYGLNHSNGTIDIEKTEMFLEKYIEENRLTSPKDTYSKTPYIYSNIFITNL